MGYKRATKKMKKNLLFVLFAFTGLLLSSCNNDQNNPETDKNNQTTPQTDTNPYPYLRVSDLMPLELMTIAQAEAKLAEMGYKGGWDATKKGYIYLSSDKNEKITLGHTSEFGVYQVSYEAEKGVIPSQASPWLKHIAEKVSLPAKAIEISGVKEISFSSGGCRGTKEISCPTYPDFLNMVSDLSSGMLVTGYWGAPIVTNNYPTGYYGGIIISYEYEDNKDYAMLTIRFIYHEQKDDKPLEE